jgi:hypothetical protein
LQCSPDPAVCGRVRSGPSVVPVVVGASARGVAADGGASLFRPTCGLSKREPAPDALAGALVCPFDPALLSSLQCGATKVGPALLSSLPSDQLFLGTTELQGCFHGRFFAGWRLNAAGSREHTGPGADLPVSQRRLASILVSACLEQHVAGLVWQHECGPGRRTTQ